jgi:hypothetical protein
MGRTPGSWSAVIAQLDADRGQCGPDVGGTQLI